MLVVMATPSFATPILADGAWYNFKTAYGIDFGAGLGLAYNHSSAAGFYSDPGVPSWTFDAVGPGALPTIMDGGELGVIGITSFANPGDGPGSCSCGDYPLPCSVDPVMSQGIFFLAPGPHSITISIESTPFPDSNLSWFRVA